MFNGYGNMTMQEGLADARVMKDAPPLPPLAQIAEKQQRAFSQFENALGVMEQALEKLHGPRPTSAQTGGPAPTFPGAVGHLAEQASALQAQAARAMDLAERFAALV